MSAASRDSPSRPGLPPAEAAVPDDRVPQAFHLCCGRLRRYSDGRQGHAVIPGIYIEEQRSLRLYKLL